MTSPPRALTTIDDTPVAAPEQQQLGNIAGGTQPNITPTSNVNDNSNNSTSPSQSAAAAPQPKKAAFLRLFQNDSEGQQQQQQQPASSPTLEGSANLDKKNNSGSFRQSGEQSNILISGLPLDFDECRLKALFAVFGDVISCKVMVDVDTGCSKGFGFVRYHRSEDARKAIESMNGKKLTSNTTRTLHVTVANHDGVPSIPENERIYVRNIPIHIPENEVCRVFSEYGEVVECKLLHHPQPDGRSKGVAFLRYKTVDGAQQAVQRTPGTRPFGPVDGAGYSKPLMVRFAESQEARQQRFQRSTDSSMSLSLPGVHQGSLGMGGSGQIVNGTQQQLQQQQQQQQPYVFYQAAPGVMPQAVQAAPQPSAFILWEDPTTGRVYQVPVMTQPQQQPMGHMPQMVGGQMMAQQQPQTVYVQQQGQHPMSLSASGSAQGGQQQFAVQYHQHPQQQQQQQHIIQQPGQGGQVVHGIPQGMYAQPPTMMQPQWK